MDVHQTPASNAPSGSLPDPFRSVIEELRSVDIRQMIDALHSTHGFSDDVGVTNVSGDSLHIVLCSFQCPKVSRIVIERPNLSARRQKSLDQRTPDESCAPSDPDFITSEIILH